MMTSSSYSMPGWLKQALDLAPLLLFGICYWLSNLMTAIIALIAGTVVTLLISYILERRIAPLPLLSAIVIAIFGGLSLWFKDDIFIKMKPTVLFALLSLALCAGLCLGKNPLKSLMGQALQLRDRGWQIMGFRYSMFFAGVALLNELIWRNFDTDTWVSFKIFGILLLTVLFALSQIPLMKRYSLD